MVQLNTINGRHTVKFLRTINECEKETVKNVLMIPMLGRIYKPDRDSDGHYIDTVGVPDNRIMVMGLWDYASKSMDEFYHVFDKDDLNESLEEITVATEK